MNLATFGNTFMTLTFSVLALALLLVYLPPQGLRLLRTTSPYWPMALLMIAFSGFLFATAPFLWAPLLTLANMTSIGACMLLAMIAASWNRRLGRGFLIGMAAGLLLATAVFEVARQAGAATFTLRVYAVCLAQGGFATWMVIELWRLRAREPSMQVRMLILFGCLYILANAARIVAAALTADPRTPNLYFEGDVLFFARVFILGSQIFLALSFNNYFLEKLWMQDREASLHHQRMFDNSPAAGVIWDDRLQVTGWNREAARLFGWSADEAMGRDVVGLLLPPGRDVAMQSVLGATLAAEQQARNVMQVQCRDGHLIDCEWSHRRMPRRGNLRPETVSMAVDISARLARERALEQDRDIATTRLSSLIAMLGKPDRDLRGVTERLALAAQTARLDIYIRDIATNETWVSEHWRELFGVGPDEPINDELFLRLVHPGEKNILEQARIDLDTRGEYDIEYRIVRPDSDVRWMATRGRYEYDEAGKRIAVCTVSLDISRRKRAELALELQQREVAHLSRVVMLGELSGGLAHELNQPLTAILSNAQAATRFIEREPVDMEEVGAILGDITAEARRAGEVIRRLRQLLSTGETQRQALDQHELINETLQLLRSDLVNQQVTVVLCLGAAQAVVYGDRVQLQQVIINIIVNACDAMKQVPPGDRVLTVSTALIDEREVLVSFTDRGCGLPPEGAGRIFDSFFSTKASGMGLGLSVCRTIVNAHGGRLWAEDAPGGGAAFHFALPAGENQAT